MTPHAKALNGSVKLAVVLMLERLWLDAEVDR